MKSMSLSKFPHIQTRSSTRSSKAYKDIKEATDLPPLLIQQIQHFFEHYKDLEQGKWVKIDGWGTSDEARKAIVDAVRNFDETSQIDR